jgi:hypothetical protein
MSDSLYFFFWMPSMSRLKVGTLAKYDSVQSINQSQSVTNNKKSWQTVHVKPVRPVLAPESMLRWLLSEFLVSKAWLMTSLMLRMEAAMVFLSRSSFATAESWSSPRRFLDELNSSMLSLFRCTVSYRTLFTSGDIGQHVGVLDLTEVALNSCT